MGLGTSSNLGRRIWNPPLFITNQKARTGGGWALAFTCNHIKRLLRSDDRGAKNKDATRIVLSTIIDNRAYHTWFSKLRYIWDNIYRKTSTTLEGRVSTQNKNFLTYTPGYQKFWTIFLYPHHRALLWKPLPGDEWAPQHRQSPIPSTYSVSVSFPERWALKEPMFPRSLRPGRGFL